MFPKFRLFKKHPKTAIAIALAAAWFVLFQWDWMPYPHYRDGSSDGSIDGRCYSPNHEYYIVRLQTPFNRLEDQLYVHGTAKLYDKMGKLLYSGRTWLSGEAGPSWVDSGNSSSVHFQGDDNWIFSLPTPPGRNFSIPNGHCF
jgi:hypothetical protein